MAKKKTSNGRTDVHRTGKRIAAIHHDQDKRFLIPSREKAGMEADNPVVQAKAAAEYPLNPVTTRGQDPELYWMHKYGPGDDETRLKVDIRSLYRHEHVEPESLIHRLYKITNSGTPQNDMFVNGTFGNLLGGIDNDAFDRLYGHRSHPIPARKGRRVAVRVISQFGEESTKVLTLA